MLPTLFTFRSAVKAVVERMTQSAFYTSARALFERDRPLFSLLCALEVTKCWSCGFDRVLWHCGPTTDLLQYSTPCSSLNKYQEAFSVSNFVVSGQIVDSVRKFHWTIVWFESNCIQSVMVAILDKKNSSSLGCSKRHYNESNTSVNFELSSRCCQLATVMTCWSEWFFLLGLFLGWGLQWPCGSWWPWVLDPPVVWCGSEDCTSAQRSVRGRITHSC